MYIIAVHTNTSLSITQCYIHNRKAFSGRNSNKKANVSQILSCTNELNITGLYSYATKDLQIFLPT